MRGTGRILQLYINQRRAAFAAELLAASDKPIKVIMFESGFRSKSTFNREFQRCFSRSPSEFRRQSEANEAGRH
jgi:AraC-like DNA-binding protein